MGDEIEKQQLPNDLEFIGNTIIDICYNNSVQYFNLPSYVNKI
jgi:glucuronate isomerase